MISTKYIGNNFYNLMLNQGEDYFLEQMNGEIFNGKISLEPKTSSTYMLAEREYLMIGAATFPDIHSQTTFRGCYFKRNINPEKDYIMVSTIPETTDGRVGYVYAIQCNEEVTLANLERQRSGDTLDIFQKSVKVYFDGTLQKQRRSSDGNFDNTLYYMQMPAHYGISQDQVVLRKAFKWNKETKINELVNIGYRVESVELSMVTNDENGIYGICDVQMALDTRAYDIPKI